MSKIINNDSVMEPFLQEPDRWFHVREIAGILRLNPTTITKHTDDLCKRNLLIKKTERNLVLIKASNESPDYKDIKIYYNIKRLRKSGLIDHLERALGYPETIVLFGSCARGENDPNSDIDIFMICNKKTPLDLEKFERKLSGKIQIFLKTKREFIEMERSNKNLVNSILNGIVLKGYLEAFV